MKRLMYLNYLINWKLSHRGKAFKGCCPVCYDEWCDCELAEMIHYPEEYPNHWYTWYIRKCHEEKARTF